MKKIIILSCFTIFLLKINYVFGQQPREYLDVGDSVTSYSKVEWLKGNPIEKFDKKKVYIVELWATWCKPCIASMPHLNSLADKFKSRGVIFIAQDVMEEDKQKVVDFLRANDKIMGFNVGYGGGKGSDFERDWIKSAGVSTIPQTFVIYKNTLIWQTMPDMITEKVLEMILNDEFSIEKARNLPAKGK